MELLLFFVGLLEVDVSDDGLNLAVFLLGVHRGLRVQLVRTSLEVYLRSTLQSYGLRGNDWLDMGRVVPLRQSWVVQVVLLSLQKNRV